jgi:antigen 43
MAITTVTWSSATNGAYTTAAGWTPAVAPITANQATIIDATGAAYTVSLGSVSGTQSYSTATVTVNSADATLQWVGTHTLNTFDVALNAGTIAVSTGRLAVLTTTAVANSATLSVTGGSFNESGGTVTVTSLASFTGGSSTISGGIFNAGSLQIGDGSTSGTFLVLNGGTIDGNLGNAATTTIRNNATLGVQGTTSRIKSTLDGTGDIAIGSGNSLTIDGSLVASGLHLDLGGIGSELILGNAAALSGFHATVHGLIDGGSASAAVNGIEITGVGSGVVAAYNSGTITLSGSVTGSIALDPSELYVNTTTAEVSFSGGNTDIFLFNSAVCFAEGTRILTDRGEVAVEQLMQDDMVIAVDQGVPQAHPVTWIGFRRMDLSTHPRAALATPVRIRKDAFADNQPQRDLVVSPDHCLYVDGKLIPAKLLLNGMTIVQAEEIRAVTYYHVQLDRHAVLLAEGLPAESYLDTGNRSFFSNAGMALMLHPEFHVNAGLKCWEQDACAPLAVSETIVLPAWQALAARAEALGYQRPDITTLDEPDLRLVVAGHTFRPVSVHANRHVFVLPGGTTSARILSRANAPAEIWPWLEDWRQLGVAVNRVVVRGDVDHVDIPVDHPALRDGWHAVETAGRAMWRWTTGDAMVPLAAGDGPVTVEIHLRQSGTYLLPQPQTVHRIAA